MVSLPSARIAIVGAGAVGCYYGGMLARAGYDVHFLLRADLATVRAQGLSIRTEGAVHHFPVQAYGRPEEIGPVDLVIIALKATANAALEQLLPSLLGPETALLTLQNGLGNEEFLAERWGAERVLGGLCFVCLNRTAPGTIEHLDHGSISLGEWRRPVSARVEGIASAFREAGIEARAVENVLTERWRKLLWNVPFNGLSIAAGGLTTAGIMKAASLRTLARRLMTEVLEAATRLGHDIPEGFADFQLERTSTMTPYKPSSLIDWELGRPVEVEAIWGEPWRQGTAAGARMDRLEVLYTLLQQLTCTP